MPFITTNDNVSIYYEIHGEGKPLFMLPGWTCSTKFWKYNVEELSRHFQVVLMDMRGHGESEKVLHSHRISRYAMDVKNLLDALNLKDVTVLGWSMGASILWSYIELFGNYRIDSLICVDQSPAQYVKPDWPWGQKACFDVETFMETCFAAKSDPRGAAEGLVGACLKHAPSAEDHKMLVDEICKCPTWTGGISCLTSSFLPWSAAPGKARSSMCTEVPGSEKTSPVPKQRFLRTAAICCSGKSRKSSTSVSSALLKG